MPTTLATGMRRPRMQATPPIWCGFTVILVNFMCASGMYAAGILRCAPSGSPGVRPRIFLVLLYGALTPNFSRSRLPDHPEPVLPADLSRVLRRGHAPDRRE